MVATCNPSSLKAEMGPPPLEQMGVSGSWGDSVDMPFKEGSEPSLQEQMLGSTEALLPLKRKPF